MGCNPFRVYSLLLGTGVGSKVQPIPLVLSPTSFSPFLLPTSHHWILPASNLFSSPAYLRQERAAWKTARTFIKPHETTQLSPQPPSSSLTDASPTFPSFPSTRSPGLTMSGLSPARRLRTKTSDLTDFFRGNGNPSNQPRQSQKDVATSMNLEVPSGDETASVKKKITRIPLFGRSRKKSNQSSSSSPFASFVRDSSDLGEPSSASRAPSADTRCVGFFFFLSISFFVPMFLFETVLLVICFNAAWILHFSYHLNNFL